MALASLVILAVVVLVGLFVVVSLARTIRVVNQGLVGVVLRLGQFHQVRNPGLTTLMPYVDRLCWSTCARRLAPVSASTS